jgi:hypothetical protein
MAFGREGNLFILTSRAHRQERGAGGSRGCRILYEERNTMIGTSVWPGNPLMTQGGKLETRSVS